MLAALDKVDWSVLTHAYGTADDVPTLLRELVSPDADVVDRCFHALYGNVYHQGTRFEASRFVVPVLFELMPSVAPPVQVRVLRLFGDLALGDAPPSDESLPFRPEVEFADAKGVSAAQVSELYRQMLEDEDAPEDPLLDLAPLVWARDTYDTAASLAHELLVWVDRGPEEVSASAYSLTPWFPSLGVRPVHKGLELLASDRSADLVASAILTLGLIGNPSVLDAVHDKLRAADDRIIRVAAAVALALISGRKSPDAAITTLIEAEEWKPELDAATRRLPFARSLSGYVAKAIGCVER